MLRWDYCCISERQRGVWLLGAGRQILLAPGVKWWSETRRVVGFNCLGSVYFTPHRYGDTTEEIARQHCVNPTYHHRHTPAPTSPTSPTSNRRDPAWPPP